ncbi:MAG TPA: hypothetical protein VMW73_06715, partial [Spirochaetia bacterium]|nr:hypothetical protein [Spirochaetia bacterium]
LGSEYAQRLGIVLLGGILSSAILTFFVVPAAFYLFERKRPVHRKNALEEVDEEVAREELEEQQAADTNGGRAEGSPTPAPERG